MRQNKEEFQDRLEAVRAERARQDDQQPDPLPRYDEVFFEGTAWLDELAGEQPRSGRVELLFDDTAWKSPVRSEERG
jgi:hypothetical protein